jgi:hypothetical protein
MRRPGDRDLFFRRRPTLGQALTFSYATKVAIPPGVVEIVLRLVTARFKGKNRDPNLIQQDTPGLGSQRLVVWRGTRPEGGSSRLTSKHPSAEYRVQTIAIGGSRGFGEVQCHRAAQGRAACSRRFLNGLYRRSAERKIRELDRRSLRSGRGQGTVEAPGSCGASELQVRVFTDKQTASPASMDLERPQGLEGVRQGRRARIRRASRPRRDRRPRDEARPRLVDQRLASPVHRDGRGSRETAEHRRGGLRARARSPRCSPKSSPASTRSIEQARRRGQSVGFFGLSAFGLLEPKPR